MIDRAVFLQRYGRANRPPRARKVLNDAIALEAYLRRNSVFVRTSIPFVFVRGELIWGRLRPMAEFQVLVQSIRQSGTKHLRPLSLCGSRVILEAAPLLGDLLTKLGQGL